MQKESEGTRGTHGLESEREGTIQNKKGKKQSKGHSQTRERRERGVRTKEKRRRGGTEDTHELEHSGRDKSGHGKKACVEGALTSWRAQRKAKSSHGKKLIEGRPLTSWRAQRGAQVWTGGKSKRARVTHLLESEEKGTS
jgi:hypothetical protein